MVYQPIREHVLKHNQNQISEKKTAIIMMVIFTLFRSFWVRVYLVLVINIILKLTRYCKVSHITEANFIVYRAISFNKLGKSGIDFPHTLTNMCTLVLRSFHVNNTALFMTETH